MLKKPVPEEKVPVPVQKKKEVPPAKGIPALDCICYKKSNSKISVIVDLSSLVSCRVKRGFFLFLSALCHLLVYIIVLYSMVQKRNS